MMILRRLFALAIVTGVALAAPIAASAETPKFRARCDWLAREAVKAMRGNFRVGNSLEKTKTDIVSTFRPGATRDYYESMADVGYMFPDMPAEEYYYIALERCTANPAIGIIRGD